jgi:peptidoglycan/LPS O-acetylase OafA/YrhL
MFWLPPVHSLEHGFCRTCTILRNCTLNTAMKIRYQCLDVLRGFAALAVFTFHFFGLTLPHFQSELLNPNISLLAGFCGSIGTNVLMLLSGFLVGKAESEHSGSYFPSLAKRVIRIFPTYAIVVFLALLVGVIFPSASKLAPSQSILQSFFEQMVLIPGLFPGRPVMIVAWTLSYIFTGYVTLPLLARIYRLAFQNRFSLTWLWLAVMISILIAHYFSNIGFIRIAYIPAGCLIAELTLKHKIRFQGALSFAQGILGCFFLLTARYELLRDQNLSRLDSVLFSISGIGAVCGIVLLLFSAEASEWRMFNNPIARISKWLGQRGYSLYLFHGPAIKMVLLFAAYWTQTQNWPLHYLIPLAIGCLVAALTIASISYHVLETSLSAMLVRRFRLV